MTDQTTACRTTRHCADHDFCHRCMPSLDDAVQHLAKAIDAAGIEYPASGRLYGYLAAGIRDAARQASGQQPDAGPVTLATPCDNCDHALNWHSGNAACIFAFCGCGRFRAPAADEPAVGQQDATQPTADGCLRSKLDATKHGAAGALEVLAFDLATASKLIEPSDVRAAIAAHRAEVLRDAADKVDGLLVETPEYGRFVSEFLRGMAAGAES